MEGGCDTFTTVLCVVALALWQLLYGFTVHGTSDRDGLDLVLTALLYAAGLLVRRSRRARRTSERLLSRAESGRHRPRPSNAGVWRGSCTTSAPTT